MVKRLLSTLAILLVLAVPASAQWTLIDSESAASTDALAVSTPAMNTTAGGGAHLIVCVISVGAGITPIAANISETGATANTWTALTSNEVGGGEGIRFFYALNPNTGASHVFTYTHVSAPSIACLAFNGDSGASFDQEVATAQTYPGPISVGSLTPAAIDALGVAGVSYNTAGTMSLSTADGYTQVETRDKTANATGIAVAYRVFTTATAANPAFDSTTDSSMAANHAIFGIGGGGGGSTVRRRMLLKVGE